MKYIRTKDKIYSGIGTATFFLLDKGGYIENADIIAKADTIEELCDEFVAVDKETKKHLLFFSTTDSNVYEIYGAIWTDKGLIYVAKMNDKGEVELL